MFYMSKKDELLAQIDALIEASRGELAADTIKLVNIRSVQTEPAPGAPFGEGPRKVLDAFIEMGDELGLVCNDYGVGVVSAAMQAGQPDLGIWLHGDVVHEGDNWSFEPYSAVEYKGCIIGRGATDNKGQLAAVYHVFKIFKQLGIELSYNPAIYVGSNEETGMGDMTGVPGNPDAKGFLNVCTPPRLSLVPDGSFPVAYGGKGGMNITLRSKTPLHGFTMTAGSSDAPGNATAVFESLDIPDTLANCTVNKGSKTEVTTFTPPCHTTKPDPNGNMITLLCGALLDANVVCQEDRGVLEFIKAVSLDIHGKMLGVETEHDILGVLTVYPKTIYNDNGHPELLLNIRYPLGITFETIVERIQAFAGNRGFSVSETFKGVTPYMMDPNSEVIQTLTAVANEVTGEKKPPFTVNGGTYAHRLPNALVFGMNGNRPPEDFPKGRGGAHGVDEAVSLDRLTRAMRIYARALLALDELEW